MDRKINKPLGKKVIHVVQRLAPGGLETLTLDLLHFANPNDQVLIISLEGTKDESLSLWPKLTQFSKQLVFLNKAPGVQLKTMRTLIKIFKSIRPDVVHTHHIGPLLYASISARLSNVPTRIHTEHDVWHLNSKKHVALQKMALVAAKPTLVADAVRVNQQLKMHFNYDKTVTIKNGIDCQKFRPASKLNARKALSLPFDVTVIGCAGRLETVKGHDLIIKALTFLPKHVSLAIAGDGSQKEVLIKLARQLGVEQRVIFLGLVEDMPQFYQSLDLFCLPSRYEGFPLSPLEAQACNIPTVVTDVGSASETLCHESGYLSKANDIPSLAHVLLRAVSEVNNDVIGVEFNSEVSFPRTFVLENNDVRHMVKAYEELGVTA